MIHIVVGMNWFFRPDYAAGKLNRAIRDHFIGVHVGLRAGTGLEYDQRKLVIPSAIDHFLPSADNQIDLFLRKLAELTIGQSCTLLQNSESSNDRPPPAKTFDPNRKVQVRALGLCTPEMLGRNMH